MSRMKLPMPMSRVKWVASEDSTENAAKKNVGAKIQK